MPKIVDHGARREELADVVLQVIARDGISAVTLRTIAQESGWSTGVIGHYFHNRRDMLFAALRRAAYLQGNQFKITRRENMTALEQVRAALVSVLPLDERRIALTRIFLFYYAEGAQDEVSREEIAEYLRNWRRVVSRALQNAINQGELAPDTDIEAKAVQLVACADALSGHAVLDPAVMDLVRADPGIIIDDMLRPALSIV